MLSELSKITITEKGEKMLRGGHVWVFADEVISIDKPIEDGAIAYVYSTKGRYLGAGFYNSASKIRVRILSRNANDTFDQKFWQRRLEYAVSYRRSVMKGDDFKCCRLIFGEADSFPGLTVDRFNNLLVVQALSLGIDRIKHVLIPTLVDILRGMGETIDGVYERNDVAIRQKEGMEEYTDWFPGFCPENDASGLTKITENGIVYDVDVINGQKTGFFLDQKYNRASIHAVAKGKRVLDCFTHTGSFALNAAIAGASHVTAVDISEEAVNMARKNAQNNGLADRMDFVCTDVFDLLTAMADKKIPCDYDFIILDPPAFTKSRDTLKNAIRGYREINSKAMKLLPRGGYLATCSCSHFMTDTYFKQMLHNAAEDAGVSLRQIEARQQSPDHPILWNVPETDYLKFYIFQIV
jgi:23S rRNA (cytosine1962-C5)-methyltransferase